MDASQLLTANPGGYDEVALAFDEPVALAGAAEMLLLAMPARSRFLLRECPGRAARDQVCIDDLVAVAHGRSHYLHAWGPLDIHGVSVPSLSVYVAPGKVDIGYQGGPEWGRAQVAAFVQLLREMVGLGASVQEPWASAIGVAECRSVLGAAASRRGPVEVPGDAGTFPHMLPVHREFYTVENAASGMARTVATRYLWDVSAGHLVRERVWSLHPIDSEDHVVERSESVVVPLGACPSIVACRLDEMGIRVDGTGHA